MTPCTVPCIMRSKVQKWQSQAVLPCYRYLYKDLLCAWRSVCETLRHSLVRVLSVPSMSASSRLARNTAPQAAIHKR